MDANMQASALAVSQGGPGMRASPPEARRRRKRLARSMRPHRGWRVVAGAFLVLMVGYGAIYSFSAFAEQIAADFGATRASVTIIYALNGGMALLVSAVSGPLADRIGARLTASIGMALVGLGLLLASNARSLEEVIAGYGLLIGIGVGFAYVPAVATVQRWFVVYRGTASGIALSGIGVGTALVPPMSEALALLGDWRIAFAICALLAVATGLAGAAMLDRSPESLGLAPDGRRRRARAPIAAALAAPPVPMASRSFAQLYCGTMLLSVPVAIPYVLIADTALSLGHGLTESLALLGLIGIGSIAGRFVLASAADGFGRARVFLACCAVLAASMAAWAFAASLLHLQIFALLFGAVQGGFVALLPSAVTDRFGGRRAGTVIGVLYTSRALGLFLGPPLVAAGIVHAGSSVVPLLMVALLSALGVMLVARGIGKWPGAAVRLRAALPA